MIFRYIDVEEREQVRNMLKKSPAVVSESISLGRPIVAVEDDEIVGTVSLFEKEFFLEILKYVYVKKSERGRGIGRELVKKAVRMSEKPIIIATTNENNKIMEKILVGEGFYKIFTIKSPISDNRIIVWLLNKREIEYEEKK